MDNIINTFTFFSSNVHAQHRSLMVQLLPSPPSLPKHCHDVFGLWRSSKLKNLPRSLTTGYDTHQIHCYLKSQTETQGKIRFCYRHDPHLPPRYPIHNAPWMLPPMRCQLGANTEYDQVCRVRHFDRAKVLWLAPRWWHQTPSLAIALIWSSLTYV